MHSFTCNQRCCTSFSAFLRTTGGRTASSVGMEVSRRYSFSSWLFWPYTVCLPADRAACRVVASCHPLPAFRRAVFCALKVECALKVCSSLHHPFIKCLQTVPSCQSPQPGMPITASPIDQLSANNAFMPIPSACFQNHIQLDRTIQPPS